MDLRNVIGLLLLAIGLLLIVAGYAVAPKANSELFGMNLNLSWGVVLAVTGGFFVLVARGKSKPK
jgi:hypothetical protein